MGAVEDTDRISSDNSSDLGVGRNGSQSGRFKSNLDKSMTALDQDTSTMSLEQRILGGHFKV